MFFTPLNFYTYWAIKEKKMVQLYTKETLDERLVPTSQLLVEVLTGSKTTMIYKVSLHSNGNHRFPFAIHVPNHNRGFGNTKQNCYYEIDPERQRIFVGDHPFRHLDKTGLGSTFYVADTVTVQDVLTVFHQAGYEILDRKRTWQEL